jgi:CubicO group peptidase (beta-lactamase class C family)
MQLAEAGRIDLDAPVRTYLPRFQLPDPALTESITVRDLLCHRYGINNSVIVFADAYTGHITDDLYYRELAKADVAGEWAYTNVHFTLLGRLIEAVSGENWRDYLASHVFQPLGMTRTTGYATKLYAYEDSTQPLSWHPADGWTPARMRKSDSTMHAAGGLGASARDLAQWTRVFLGNGAVDGVRLLSPESVREMLTVHAEPKTSFFRFGRPEMGLGWYLGRYDGNLLVHHFGSYSGAHAHCSFMPEHGVGVAVLANSNTEATMIIHQIAADVYDAVTGNDATDPWPHFIQRTQRATERYGEAIAAVEWPEGPLTLSLPADRYIGEFQSDTWGTLSVVNGPDGLAANIGNLPILLYAGETDNLWIDMVLGRKRMHFDIRDGHVAAVEIQDFWGQTLRFERTP